ncbi:complement factor H-like isoform X2 [Betta splendens]|uniref:Complement factor H-like isoform X2 n=1 Tax=Betta splendens TaxID=158456 RepID=A0A9W2XQ24_BETSP|nr:complement factor H-like isoform X2 [Betta splendens]
MRLFNVWLFILWMNVDESLQQGASQCPPIPVGNNVQVFGDTDEATFGNVVRFSCKSSREILEGPEEVYCDETGQWSGQPPTCTAVKCKVPMIPNGFVSENKQKYYEDEVLPFECNDKYKPSEDRPSRCMKTGQRVDWSPTPGCEPIKCKLKLPPLEGTSYTPEYTNLFLPGDSVTVRCGDRYGITDRQVETADVLCKKDGEWEIQPVCREVICLKQAPHVRQWYDMWRRAVIHDMVDYYCESGYQKPHGVTRATCTRGGWRPDPLCEEIPNTGTCLLRTDPDAVIQNSKAEYGYNEQIHYVCSAGRGQFSLTCSEDGWFGFRNGSEPTDCGSPPPLPDGDVRYTMRSQYKHCEQVEYMCQTYYTMEGEPYRTCVDGEWTGHMRCLKPCIVNEDIFRQHNITLQTNDKPFFIHDEILAFKCARGSPSGRVAMSQRCSSGEVFLPSCS